jgi:hypothetical protein
LTLHLIRVESFSVVRYEQFNSVARSLQGNAYKLGLAVFNHIVERLLKKPKNDNL